jgi:macrodomain Ter protein organizer (MatP/YcbG family)
MSPMEKPTRTRTQVLVLRLNEEERALLEALSVSMSLKLSDTMRQAIRAEAKRRGITVAAAATKKRGTK